MFHLYVFQNSKSAQGLVGLRNLGNTVSVFYWDVLTVLKGEVCNFILWDFFFNFWLNQWHYFWAGLPVCPAVGDVMQKWHASPLECDNYNSHVHAHQQINSKSFKICQFEECKVCSVDQCPHSHLFSLYIVYIGRIKHVQHARNRSKLWNLTISGYQN